MVLRRGQKKIGVVRLCITRVASSVTFDGIWLVEKWEKVGMEASQVVNGF